MASTSYRTRVIVKEHTDKQADFAGTYNLLVAAKSVPSPASPPNTVESTTMEDDQQTFEKELRLLIQEKSQETLKRISFKGGWIWR